MKVFLSAGGALNIESSFIESVADGRKAAISIDRYLGGSGDIREILAPVMEDIPRVGRIDNFAQRKRQKMPIEVPAKVVGKFSQVELGFSDEIGNEEAKRCMGCDLRFAVSRLVAGPTATTAKDNFRS